MPAIRSVIVTLESISPYSQSNFFTSSKKKDETHDDFEQRCWQERLHLTDRKTVSIPSRAFKYAMDEAIKRMGVKTGKAGGKEMFTKFFQAGVDVLADLDTGVKVDEVKPVSLMLSSNGKKGKEGGTRVRRILPHVPKWTGELSMIVFDETIPNNLLEEVVAYAGLFIGVGQFRPENQGSNGRFRPTEVVWGDAA